MDNREIYFKDIDVSESSINEATSIKELLSQEQKLHMIDVRKDELISEASFMGRLMYAFGWKWGVA